MSEDIALTRTFVAGADTPTRLARAFIAHRHRQWQAWVLYGAFMAVFAIVFLTGMDARFSLAVRVVWSLLFALVPTLLLVACIVVLTYRLTVRSARVRLPAGSVVETGFGEDEFIAHSPLSDMRIRYRGVQWIQQRGDFVFLRQRGVNMINAFPREVFPDEAVDRIKRVASR